MKWNLDITTKLAYCLSVIMVICFSSAFITLANAAGAGQPRPFPSGATGMDNNPNPAPDYSVDADTRRIRAVWDKSRANQDAYIDRWQVRKHEYRLREQYADWLDDHNDPGAGIYGAQGFNPEMKPYTMPLPTFFDLFVSVF